jgi:hypothetical protein
MTPRVRAQSNCGESKDLEDGLGLGQRRLADGLHDSVDHDLKQFPGESRREPPPAGYHGVPYGVGDHCVRVSDWSDNCRCGGENSTKEMRPERR